MAAYVRFLYNFEFDSATITSSSEYGDLVDDNVVHKYVGKAWQATGKTEEWLKFNCGSATNIKEIAIFGYNLTSGATITLCAHATDLGDNKAAWSGVASYETTLTYNAANLLKFLNETYQWGFICFEDAGNSDNIQIGRVCSGVYLDAAIIPYDWSRSRIDPSIKQRTEGYQGASRVRDKYWQYQIEWRYLSETDRDNLFTMFESIGNTEPVVISISPDGTLKNKYTIYAELVTPFEEVFRKLDRGDVIKVVFTEIL